MVLKRHYDEEGRGDSPININSQNPPTKFRKVVNYVLKEISLQEIADRVSAMLEPTLRKVVKEEMEHLNLLLQPSPRCSLVHQLESSASRVLQLHFTKKLPSTLFTNNSIHSDEHAPLQVMLFDARSKHVIQHGPLSSAKVEVVVLNADFATYERDDWSESEFNNSVVRERDGKRPLLVGDLSFPLFGGVGFVNNVTFTDNSSWMRSRKFRLGVRVVPSALSGTPIREAVSEAFVVLDHRGESYQKHNTPSLDDPVWRLKKISKSGASHKKLESHGIMTVKDFLMHYYINPLLLRHVLGKGIPNRTWETMVKHANECLLDNTQYSFYSEAEGVQLIFNCVYKVIAVKFGSLDYQSPDALDFRQKALVDKLRQYVFDHSQLIQTYSSSAAPPLLSSPIEQNLAGENLELELNNLSSIEQAKPDQQLDFNLSDSVSFPCTVEDLRNCILDDSTAQSNRHLLGFSPTTFLMGDSTAEPYDRGYNLYHNNDAVSMFAPDTQSRELSHFQNSSFYPFTTTLGQDDDGLLPTAIPGAHFGIISQPPDFGIKESGTEKAKAGWSMIRAAVMWKIVRRNAAARRKAKHPFDFY